MLLVTGAGGFVGRALVAELQARGSPVRVALRRPGSVRRRTETETGCDAVVVGDIGPDTDWSAALSGVDAVVHLAARVHMTRQETPEEVRAYDAVNRAGTERLAQATIASGIRRFVFLSTVKVNGEDSGAGAFRESDRPRPSDPYAASKWRAEQELNELAAAGAFEPVIIRPPLVYGPGVKANFLSLMRAVDRGWPLPLGAVTNQRSFIYVGNLVNVIMACLEHPAAAGRTYLVADDSPVSTPELVRRIARALERPARLVPVPAPLMRLAGRVTGRADSVERLLGSLAVDDSLVRRELGWNPPYSMDDGLRATAAWFRSQSGR